MNDIEKAIDVLKRLRIAMATSTVDGFRVLEPLGMAVEALEKQVTKKPTCIVNDSDFKIGNITFKKGTKRYQCSCGNLISYSHKYCPHCGCLIGWEEEK